MHVRLQWNCEGEIVINSKLRRRAGFARLSVVLTVGAIASLTALSAHAVPRLQIGAPAGPGDVGALADYQGSLTNPTEEDTAVTTGNSILVGGVYKGGVLNMGGKFGSGKDWSELSFPSQFDGHGAVLVVAVPDGQTGSVKINLGGGDLSPFYSTTTNIFPNNHDPLKDDVSDFLYFDIGTFAKINDAVPDFADETGGEDGEIKNIAVEIVDFDWAHFDVLAIETKNQGQTVRSTAWNNPGSHDVTWNNPTNGGTTTGGTTTLGGTTTGDDQTGSPAVPEPATAALAGLSMFGLAIATRRRRR